MEPTDSNRRAWDDVHRRAQSRGAGLPAPVRHALAGLEGKRVLNIGCGTGEAAAELAGLGATVTGVDPSSEALDVARGRWPSILWIQGELEPLPSQLLRSRFELVFCGEGVVDEVPDLAAWAAGVNRALRPGGDLLLHDEHPVARCVDGLMHWRESYFDEGALRLGGIVTAVASAGLVVRALEEYPQQHGNLRRHDARVPGTFLLHARRPAVGGVRTDITQP